MVSFWSFRFVVSVGFSTCPLLFLKMIDYNQYYYECQGLDLPDTDINTIRPFQLAPNILNLAILAKP